MIHSWKDFLKEFEILRLKFEEKYGVPDCTYEIRNIEVMGGCKATLFLTSEYYSPWVLSVTVFYESERIIFSPKERDVSDLDEALTCIKDLLNNGIMEKYLKSYQRKLKEK